MQQIPIFLSYPKPCHSTQEQFVAGVGLYLVGRGLQARTLGVTDYDTDAPLKAVRRLMLECNGLITIGFKRNYIEKGTSRYSTDLPDLSPTPLDGQWTTTPWAQIEAAMAYQLGLPILILREKGVIEEGILEKGVVGLYMPEFDVEKPLDRYFNSTEWTAMLGKWEWNVRSVVEHKGNPPQLY
jgi:hypothetical protein